MAEKEHDPTPHRLREARKRGEVVFSADISATATFVIVVVALWLLGGTAFSLFRELWRHATSAALFTRPDERFPELLLHTAEVLLWGTVPLMAIAALAAAAGSFFQIGGVAAWSRLKPDMNHLNPAAGLQRIFSTRNLVNLVKMVVKTLLLAALIFVVIGAFLDDALELGYAVPASVMAASAQVLVVIFGWAAVIYAVMAGIDYAHVRYEFMKEQRMSTEELQREHKDMEGDPLNAARRRMAHVEAVYMSLGDRVRMASAVVYSARNAVALQYLGERDLPRVVARGEGEMAAQIRRFAADNLIPMEHDTALAGLLYDQVPLDQPVPRSLYRQTARLLRWAGGEG